MKRGFAILLILTALMALCSCGGSGAAQATTAAQAEQTTAAAQAKLDMAALYEEMKDSLPEMIEMDADTLRDYCGVEPESYIQAVAAINYNGLETDEIWLIEAADEEAADSIVEMAELRLKMKGEETESYAPDQYKVVQKAKLIREGLYIALIVTPESEALAEQFQTALAGE